MKLFSISLLILFLSGCAATPPWQYEAQSNKDPEISFGDRPKITGTDYARRYFAINVNDATSLTCEKYKDFSEVGEVGGFYAKEAPKTIRIPVGKAIAIHSVWDNGGVSTCAPPTMMFIPKSGGRYSVEIRMDSEKCTLSIVNISNKGEQLEVNERTRLSDCK